MCKVLPAAHATSAATTTASRAVLESSAPTTTVLNTAFLLELVVATAPVGRADVIPGLLGMMRQAAARSRAHRRGRCALPPQRAGRHRTRPTGHSLSPRSRSTRVENGAA